MQSHSSLQSQQNCDCSIGYSAQHKASEELSQNPPTVLNRERRQAMDNYELVLEKAKKVDISALAYARKKMMKTSPYLQATEDVKAQMYENLKIKYSRQSNIKAASWYEPISIPVSAVLTWIGTHLSYSTLNE